MSSNYSPLTLEEIRELNEEMFEYAPKTDNNALKIKNESGTIKMTEKNSIVDT